MSVTYTPQKKFYSFFRTIYNFVFGHAHLVAKANWVLLQIGDFTMLWFKTSWESLSFLGSFPHASTKFRLP
jgi:hypothetical protein